MNEIQDILTLMYNVLFKDEYIKATVGNRVKYYDYPETMDHDNPFLIITPIDTITVATVGSNQPLTVRQTVQVAFEGSDRMIIKKLQNHAVRSLTEHGFSLKLGGLDEYFKDTAHYVDVRRYEFTSPLYDAKY